MFAAFLCTFLFSLSVICGHRSAKLVGGTEANFWRIVVAAIFLGIWSYTFGRGLGGEALPWFVFSGVMGIGVGDTTFFQALPRLGSRLSLLLIECLSAPFGALIEWLWLGTRLTFWQIGCVVVILVGVALALRPGKNIKLSRADLIAGTGYSTAAALATAVGAVLSRKAYAVAHASGVPIDPANAGFQRVAGGLLIAGIVLLAVKRRQWQVQNHAPCEVAAAVTARKWQGIWFWVLINGLAGQTLGVTCMQMALETTPTGLVLAIIAITPIMVIPLAYVFEGERPSTLSLAGGAVAVAGVLGLAAGK